MSRPRTAAWIALDARSGMGRRRSRAGGWWPGALGALIAWGVSGGFEIQGGAAETPQSETPVSTVEGAQAPAPIRAEADRLLALLNAEEVPKRVLDAGFSEFSAASKDAVVERVVRMTDPPPRGPLLARLLRLRTEGNQAVLQVAYLNQLRSPDAEARKFSLIGLRELGHPAITDLALVCLRDESDGVLAIAVDLLAPRAGREPAVAALLRDLHARHRGDARFHLSLAVLESRGFGSEETPGGATRR